MNMKNQKLKCATMQNWIFKIKQLRRAKRAEKNPGRCMVILGDSEKSAREARREFFGRCMVILGNFEKSAREARREFFWDDAW